MTKTIRKPGEPGNVAFRDPRPPRRSLTKRMGDRNTKPFAE